MILRIQLQNYSTIGLRFLRWSNYSIRVLEAAF
jgi:hypothetical protein